MGRGVPGPRGGFGESPGGGGPGRVGGGPGGPGRAGEGAGRARRGGGQDLHYLNYFNYLKYFIPGPHLPQKLEPGLFGSWLLYI